MQQNLLFLSFSKQFRSDINDVFCRIYEIHNEEIYFGALLHLTLSQGLIRQKIKC